MKKLVGLLLLLSVKAWGLDCSLNEEQYREDLARNLRSLFEVPRTRRVEWVDNLEKAQPEKEVAIILLERLSEDRVFFTPRPNPKNPCPDQIIRLFHVLDQDEYRKCNAILRSDYVEGTHVILYRHCVEN